MSTPDARRPDGEQPRMGTTRPATLLVAALAAAGMAWLFIDRCYGWMPALPWLPPLTMISLAFVEIVAGWQTKARIERRAGAAPVVPLLVARYVVLAKASALAGALFGGAYFGLTSWLFLQRQTYAHARDDLTPSAFGLIGSALLVGAALWLERACRVPPSQRDGDHLDGRFGDRTNS